MSRVVFLLSLLAFNALQAAAPVCNFVYAGVLAAQTEEEWSILGADPDSDLPPQLVPLNLKALVSDRKYQWLKKSLKIVSIRMSDYNGPYDIIDLADAYSPGENVLDVAASAQAARWTELLAEMKRISALPGAINSLDIKLAHAAILSDAEGRHAPVAGLSGKPAWIKYRESLPGRLSEKVFDSDPDKDAVIKASLQRYLAAGR